MKKIILSLSVLLSVFYAKAQDEVQEKQQEKTEVISLEFDLSVGVQIGLTFEEPIKSRWLPNLKSHGVLKILYSENSLESSAWVNDIKGTGFQGEFGTKTYLSTQDYKGFYYANYLLFGNLEFDDTARYFFGENRRFAGKYRYFSLFSPEIGWKFLLFNQNIALDLHAGVSWLIEFKGKGDVDNKSFDNWVPKLGIALGYRF